MSLLRLRRGHRRGRQVYQAAKVDRDGDRMEDKRSLGIEVEKLEVRGQQIAADSHRDIVATPGVQRENRDHLFATPLGRLEAL